MRLNKAIKRIIALGTGVTMVGATILGAMAAADLSAYPKPFVDNGAFNALIVVGSNGAKVEDVLGSIDIATSLQYATTKTVAVPGAGSSASVSGEGVKIETANNKLIIGESLPSVKSKLDETELPTLLAKGTYVNDGDDQSDSFDFTQKIEFSSSPVVTFLKSTDYKDENNPYVMLFGNDGAEVLTYTLDFTKLAESKWYTGTTCGSADELCDFEGTKIDILGINYEVTNAAYDGTSDLTWEMMGGTSLNTMYEGETKTFTIDGKDYEVTVDIISDGESTVVMTVNGISTKELAKDQTQKVAGIEIGIKKLMSNEAGEEGAGKGLVQFYLGANKVTLSDDVTAPLGDKVKLGSTTVDDLYVDWTVSDATPSTGDIFKLQKLELTWVPEEDMMLASGDSAKFPGLGSFNLDFAGLTTADAPETISLSPKSDDRIELKAPLESGDLSLSILYTADNVDWTGLGNSATVGQGVLQVAAGNLTKGDYLVLSSAADEESHVVKLENVDTDGIARFQDISSGTKYEGSCESGCVLYIGNTDLTLTSATDASPDIVLVAASGTDESDLIYTKGGMTIDLGDAVGDAAFDIVFTESDENGVLGGGNEFTVVADATSKSSIDSVSGDLVTGPDSNTAYEVGDDTDNMKSMTDFGTTMVLDASGDQGSIDIVYPGEQLNAQVFVNSAAAQIVSGSSGGSYQEVQKIEVGAAVLDTEVADVAAQNLIVVGGPCVNAVAAELMGNPAACYAGFEDGKAMIKLFEQSNGKVALLVAGAQAMDTRRASRVVAKYDTYANFKGTELEVTGTSLSDIKVGVPTPAPVTE